MVRHGTRNKTSFLKEIVKDANGTPYVQFQTNNLISSDSQFGTMKAVTAIRALKAALARGEQQQTQGFSSSSISNSSKNGEGSAFGSFGDVKTSQMASKLPLRKNGYDSSNLKSSNSSSSLDNRYSNNTNNSQVNRVRRIPSYPDILKHAGRNSLSNIHGPPPVSPIRRSIMRKHVAGKTKKTQQKPHHHPQQARLSFQNLEIDEKV